MPHKKDHDQNDESGALPDRRFYMSDRLEDQDGLVIERLDGYFIGQIL